MKTFLVTAWKCFFKGTFKHPLLLFASLGGIAAGTGIFSALNLANDRALRSFEISAQGLQRPGGQTGHSMQWRLPGRRVPLAALTACLGHISEGITCRGWVSEAIEAKNQDGKKIELQLIGIDGSFETVAAPIFSEGLDSEARELISLQKGRALTAKPATVIPGSDPILVLDFPDALTWLGSTGVSSPGYDWIEASMEPSLGERQEGEDEKVFDNIVRRIEADFKEPLTRTSAQKVFESERALTSTYRFNLNVLGLMSILVGALLVANVSALYLLIKKPVVAVLRQLGASQNSVLRLVVMEQIGLGLIGSLLGLFLGLGLESLISHEVMRTLSNLYLKTAVTRPVFSLRLALSAVGLGTSVFVLSGLASARLLIKTPPAALAKRAQQAAKSPWSLLWLGLICLAVIVASPYIPSIALPWIVGSNSPQPVAGYLAAGSIFVMAYVLSSPSLQLAAWLSNFLTPSRIAESFPAAAIAARRTRHAGTRGRAQVATLAGGLSLVVGTTLMIGGFKESLTGWLNQAFNAELAALPLEIHGSESKPRLTENELVRLRKLKSLAGIDCLLIGEGEILQGDSTEKTAPVRIAAVVNSPVRIAAVEDALLPGRPIPIVPVDFPAGESPRQTLENLRASSNQALVSETLSNKLHVRLGDEIKVDLGDKLPIRLKIRGVFREYSSEAGYVMLPRAAFMAHTPLNGCSNLRLYTQDPKQDIALKSVLTELRQNDPELLGKLKIFPTHELKQNAIHTFEETFAITAVLSVLAAILGGLALLTQLIQSTAERKPEWLALRRLGCNRGQLLRFCAADILLSVVSGSALGFVCGVLLGWVLCKSINLQAFGWTVQFGSTQSFIESLRSSFFFAVGLWGIGIVLSWVVLRPSLNWKVERE